MEQFQSLPDHVNIYRLVVPRVLVKRYEDRSETSYTWNILVDGNQALLLISDNINTTQFRLYKATFYYFLIYKISSVCLLKLI